MSILFIKTYDKRMYKLFLELGSNIFFTLKKAHAYVKYGKEIRCHQKLVQDAFFDNHFHSSSHIFSVQPFVPVKESRRHGTGANNGISLHCSGVIGRLWGFGVALEIV